MASHAIHLESCQEQLRIGLTYESDIALAARKKIVENIPDTTDQNPIPIGTLVANKRCKYHHPQFCTAVEHVYTRDMNWYAHLLSMEDHDKIVAVIFDDAVQQQLEESVDTSNQLCILF